VRDIEILQTLGGMPILEVHEVIEGVSQREEQLVSIEIAPIEVAEVQEQYQDITALLDLIKPIEVRLLAVVTTAVEQGLVR